MHKITLNDEQLRIVSKALDIYSRLGIGQFEELANIFRLDERVDLEGLRGLERIMDMAKKVALDLPSNASHGIGHPEVPDDYKVARDMNMSMEHHIWKHKGNGSIMSVHSSPPFAFGQQPLIEIEAEHEGNEDGY